MIVTLEVAGTFVASAASEIVKCTVYNIQNVHWPLLLQNIYDLVKYHQLPYLASDNHIGIFFYIIYIGTHFTVGAEALNFVSCR